MQRTIYQYVNYDFICDMADGDEAFILELINEYNSSITTSVEELKNAIELKNWAGVKFYAHKLKGTFKFIGADATAEIMSMLEGVAETGDVDSTAPHLLNRLMQQLAKIDGDLSRIAQTIQFSC